MQTIAPRSGARSGATGVRSGAPGVRSGAAARLGISPGVGRLLLVVAVFLGALLGTAAPASAHAALTGSDPKQGAVVDKAPATVSLTFSEKVAMSDGSVRVLDPAGKRVDTGKTSDLGSNTYGVKLHKGLPDGTFTVAYQVVSADSHPISGAFTFSVGAPSDTKVALPDQEAGGGFVGGLYGFARYLSYAGFILVVGGAAFVLGCWPRGAGVRPVQRLVVSGWVTLTASTLVLLLLRAPYTGSGKIADAFDMAKLGDVLQTKTGAALVSRLLLLAAAALFIAVLFGAYEKRTDPKERKDLTFGLAIGGGVVAAGLGATWAMAEHASTGIQAGLAMPVDIVHLLAVAAWLGGLSALVVALYFAPSVDAAAVRRFSHVAFCSVVALAATGLYQSWRQVGSWSALTGTWYGQLLLIKVGLVVVLVGVAGVSRRWTARIAEQSGDVAPEAAAATVVEKRAERSSAAKRTEKKPVTVPAGGTGADSKGSNDSKEPKGPKEPKEPKGSKGSNEPKDAKNSKDPERSAQLARQQAAMSTAREKRIRDADPNRSGLRRSVLAEAGIAVVLLAVTTVLTSTEPGRTEEEAAASKTAAAAQRSGPLTLKFPFDTGADDGKGTLQLDLDPGRTGSNDMHIFVKRPNGSAFDIPEVKVSFTLESKDVGPLPVAPDHIATGHWSSSGVQIPMAGKWKIAVTVRTSDIDQVTVNKNAQIG
ncbi:transport integral membrane protein [Streptomyces longisporoflavus]|uniref:copper resistance CopC/CopD family protein n=1 Tax=Streptomyces longisporoflavus TaxID=28044 RepID=UPI00167CE45F|nr:copper resistance CopC family protein [Streptomyces longisporoflavus]GGV49419.1 transport integral membrane protein [Streptomyces longisporoflavus]